MVRPVWAAMLARCSAAKYSALEMAAELPVEADELEVDEERKPIVVRTRSGFVVVQRGLQTRATLPGALAGGR